MSKIPGPRREIDRALTNIEHVLLHLANCKEYFKDGKHDEYVKAVDQLGKQATMVKMTLEQFRQLL